MGATASRSSSSPPTSRATVRTQNSTAPPSPPTSCAMAKTEYSETRLFKITEYSESAQLAPGSTLTLDTFQFRGQGWRVDLQPVGGLACLDSVTVSVTIVADHGWNSPENTRTRVSIDILDERRERAVFDHQRTQSEKNEGCGFLSVSKTELEESSCIQDDCLTVRCTLSVDVSLAPEVDVAGGQALTAEPGLREQRDAAPTSRTARAGADASVPATSSSSSAHRSNTPKLTCGFGWLAGGCLRRRRLRDAFGIRRYGRVESSIDGASTADGSGPDRTPLLIAT
uniref:Uncharacterized protein n=1 Tax=Avena sativa TaxID=4498 RepID=A0ACD5UBC5_AVESA